MKHYIEVYFCNGEGVNKRYICNLSRSFRYIYLSI